MSIIDYKKSKKDLLINKAISDQKMLIENIKQQYGEDFKNRLSLQEIKIVNEIIYQKLEEKDKVDIFYEFVDKVISTALFYSVDNEKFNINCLIDSICMVNLKFMILTSSDLKQTKNQLENIEITSQIVEFKK